MKDPECLHDRVLRLAVPDCGDFWLCAYCNAQFVPKAAVDWKIAHLTAELGKRMLNEQAAGVWREEGI